MKAVIMRQLDEKNEEIADELIFLGMSRPVARILSYLKNVNEVTSIELERGTGLRQPEISVAMRELKERGWINERDEKKPSKGRPYKIYWLKIGFKDIIDQIERQQKKAIEDSQAKIERLKELGVA